MQLELKFARTVFLKSDTVPWAGSYIFQWLSRSGLLRTPPSDGQVLRASITKLTVDDRLGEAIESLRRVPTPEEHHSLHVDADDNVLIEVKYLELLGLSSQSLETWAEILRRGSSEGGQVKVKKIRLDNNTMKNLDYASGSASSISFYIPPMSKVLSHRRRFGGKAERTMAESPFSRPSSA